MSSLSRLMNDTLFLTDRSSLLCVDSSKDKSKSNLQQKDHKKDMTSLRHKTHSRTSKDLPADLSLNSGLRSLFLVAVFLLLAAFLSGNRSRLTYGSAPSLEQDAKALLDK